MHPILAFWVQVSAVIWEGNIKMKWMNNPGANYRSSVNREPAKD